MNLLLSDNTSRSLEVIPDEIDDVSFCVLDFSTLQTDPDSVDFYFRPLRVVEEFGAAAALLQVGDRELRVPLNWHILTVCPDTFEIQMTELTELHNFSFGGDDGLAVEAFVCNPLSRHLPRSGMRIVVKEVFKDVRWRAPSAEPKEAVAVALEDGEAPHCAFLSRKGIRMDGVDRSAIW